MVVSLNIRIHVTAGDVFIYRKHLFTCWNPINEHKLHHRSPYVAWMIKISIPTPRRLRTLKWEPATCFTLPFGGMGVGYMITPNVDISVNFDRFGGNHDGGSVNYTSLGVGVDF